MKGVLFDFGGTLDTNGVHWSEKFWEWYEHFEVDVSKKAFEAAFVQSEGMLVQVADIHRATFQRTLHRQFALQFGLLGLDGEDQLLKKIIDACYAEVKENVERARKLLEELQPAYALGIVSNFYGNLPVVCEEFGLTPYLKAMIDSSVVGVRKPDPEIFRLSLKELGTTPGQTFVVGDSYDRDIVPAKAIGCKTIWLKGKSWTAAPATTEAADHTITSLEQIKAILLSLTSASEKKAGEATPSPIQRT